MAATSKTKQDLAHRDVFRVTFHPGGERRTDPTGHESHPPEQSLIWDARGPLGLGYPFCWSVERTENGIRVRRLDGPTGKAHTGSVKEFSFSEFEARQRLPLLGSGTGAQADREAPWFSLQPVMGTSETALPEIDIQQYTWPETIPATAEDGFFGKVLAQVLVGAALATVMLWVVPKPKSNVDELIPPQFAKLLLKPTQKTETAESKHKAVESTREQNVVRAFQSKALQTTAKKLVNLSQISGLSKAALVGGLGSAGAAAKVFNGKASSSTFKGLDSSMLAATAPKLNSVGGKNGYQGSDSISIGGQGGGQLAFDPNTMEIADGLDKDQVGKAIRAHVGEIRYCYETALVRNPSLEGKLLVTFVISAAGTVKSATNKQTNADAGLVKCIIDHLQKWTFPKPYGGTEVEVSYPFIFKSIGG